MKIYLQNEKNEWVLTECDIDSAKFKKRNIFIDATSEVKI